VKKKEFIMVVAAEGKNGGGGSASAGKGPEQIENPRVIEVGGRLRKLSGD